MLDTYYTRSELTYIVAMSGFIMFPFWKLIHSVGSIFDSFPGRVHASMVFGTALVALVKVILILFSFFHSQSRIYKPFLILRILQH
jgi:hypothetical protein